MGGGGGKALGGKYGTISQKKLGQLEDMGANRWTKGEHDRLYLGNAIPKMIGLEVRRYNSGNISSATLEGESISNSRARGILSAFDSAYIDLKDGGIRNLSETKYYSKDKLVNILNKYRVPAKK